MIVYHDYFCTPVPPANNLMRNRLNVDYKSNKVKCLFIMIFFCTPVPPTKNSMRNGLNVDYKCNKVKCLFIIINFVPQLTTQ